MDDDNDAHLVRRSHLGPAVRSLRAVGAGHRILPVSHTGPGHAAGLHRIVPEEHHAAVGRHSRRVAVQVRGNRSRVGSESRCCADHRVGTMLAVRCQYKCRLRRRLSRGCSRSHCWKACYAAIN